MDKYVTPSMEVEIMENEDIITSSNDTPFVPTNYEW